MQRLFQHTFPNSPHLVEEYHNFASIHALVLFHIYLLFPAYLNLVVPHTSTKQKTKIKSTKSQPNRKSSIKDINTYILSFSCQAVTTGIHCFFVSSLKIWLQALACSFSSCITIGTYIILYIHTYIHTSL